MKKGSRFWVLFAMLTILSGCGKLFQSSPYDNSIPAGMDSLNTAVNMARIRALPSPGALLKIAFIADPHYGYDKLRDAISEINKDTDVSFVILCGDYSDQGLTGEYVLFYEQMKLLNKPFLTVIGNHDHLASAAGIYGEMFGAVNYVFDYSGYRFVFFDDDFWEKNGVPDFNWLETQLDGANNLQPIVIAHIPPDGDQFDSASRARYEGLMRRYNVPLSIHGHNHTYQFRQTETTLYYTVPSTLNRQYSSITLSTGRQRFSPGPAGTISGNGNVYSLINY